MSSSHVTTHLNGTLHVVDGRGVVRMEDEYDTDIDDLWSALTEPDRLRRWIGEVSGDLRLGGELQLALTSSWTGRARVEVCEAPHRLEVEMGLGEDEQTRIVAELVAVGDRTRLVLEERGFAPDETPVYGAGWHAHMLDLAALVQDPSHEASREEWHEGWQSLIASYRSRTPIG